MLAFIASLPVAPRVFSAIGEGSGSISVEIGEVVYQEDIPKFSADAAGEYFVDTFFTLVGGGQYTVRGQGDPFLSYDLTYENTDAEEHDVFFGVTIDIDPVMGGLPVISTLDVVITDPNGAGVDTTVLHRGFFQGVDQDYVSVGIDGYIWEPIANAGSHRFEIDSVVPEPQPWEGDAFDRLRVATQFVIRPGVTFNLKGNTTIFMGGETSNADFDEDGDVDGNDFLVWQRDPSVGNLSDWEHSYGGGTSPPIATSIPEPTSLFSALAAVASICLLRNRRA